MQPQVKILHLEDDELDAQLVAHRLRDVAGGVEIIRVQDEAGFLAGLALKDLDLILSDKDLPNYDGLRAAAFAQRQRPELPFVFVSGTLGEERVVEMMRAGATDYVFKDKLGKLPLAVERVLREAKDRRQLEESRLALAANEERFRQMAGAIRDTFYLATHDGSQMLYVSPGYEVMWQRTVDSVSTDPSTWVDSIYPPEDRERVVSSMFGPGSVREPQIEFRIQRPDGSVRWIQTRSTLLLDERGNPSRQAGISADITARKQADMRIATEHAVARCLSAARTLEAAAPGLVTAIIAGLDWQFGAIWAVEPHVDTLRCLATAVAAGADPTAFASFTRHVTIAAGVGLVGKAWVAAAPVRGRDLPLKEESLSGQLSRAAIAFPILSDTQVIGVIEIHSNRLEDESDPALLQTLVSIGTHVGAFVRSRERDAMLHLRQRVIQSSRQGLMIVDLLRPSTPIIDVNPAFELMTGYSAAEVIGKDPGILTGPDMDPGEIAPHIAAIKKGTAIRRELQIYHKCGNSFWCELSVDPVHDAEGKLTHSATAVVDISERRTLEEQFRQSQKLEAVGHLAGGVAHDFNNLLSVILGYAQLAISDLPEGSKLVRPLEAVLRAGNRGASLTRQLLLFSRKQLLRPRVLDLNTLIAAVEKMLRVLIGADVQLSTHLEPALWRVRADPAQVEQVLMNLAINARDAMPRGGRIVVESKNVHLNNLQAEGRTAEHGERYAMFSVSDTGSGMSADTQKNIFEPFFTTKPVGKGTGLGLATVFGIVKQSDGHITVYSEVGKGTCFRVYFPQVEADLDLPVPAHKESGSFRGTETVLVAEDDEELRSLVVRLLIAKGYNVLQAASGAEVLIESERHVGPIHLLLSDVVMPEISGPDAAACLRKTRPELNVLFMSGYTERAVILDHNLDPLTNFIDKPFNPGLLLSKVRRILDRDGATDSAPVDEAEDVTEALP